jgi:hypothetical protein
MQPPQPAHPLPALATFELDRYRRELEHALRGLPIGAASRPELQQRLAEVMDEQDSRIAPAAGSSRGPGTGTTVRSVN